MKIIWKLELFEKEPAPAVCLSSYRTPRHLIRVEYYAEEARARERVDELTKMSNELNACRYEIGLVAIEVIQ